MATGRTTLQPVETTASFVARHALAVRRYLRMHGADPHTAEDLTQEAFVTALQKGAMDLEPAAAHWARWRWTSLPIGLTAVAKRSAPGTLFFAGVEPMSIESTS